MPFLQPAMTQLWHSLVDTIRVLPTIPPNKAEEEKKTLGDALEKLDMLMALRRGERSTPDLLFVDDDGNVQDVQKDYVVAVSISFHEGVEA